MSVRSAIPFDALGAILGRSNELIVVSVGRLDPSLQDALGEPTVHRLEPVHKGGCLLGDQSGCGPWTELAEWADEAGVERADIVSLQAVGAELEILQGAERLASEAMAVCIAGEHGPSRAPIAEFLRGLGFEALESVGRSDTAVWMKRALLRPSSALDAPTARNRVDAAAADCARRGRRRIALFGAGRHTRRLGLAPWESHGIRVVAILDDQPPCPELLGVPVRRPHELDEPVDAVVVSSDACEDALAGRARQTLGARGVPVVTIYGHGPTGAGPTTASVSEFDLSASATRAKRQLVRSFAPRVDGATLIETGTLYGQTIWAAKDAYRRIISIELDPRLAERARRRFRRHSHVSIVTGDSGRVMGQVLKSVRGPCVFWLDGHYSWGVTAQGEKQTPIMAELDHIFARPAFEGRRDVLLIDDARLFDGHDDYPTLNALGQHILAKRPRWTVEVEDDVIRAHAPA
jgi:hypothetical protein